MIIWYNMVVTEKAVFFFLGDRYIQNSMVLIIKRNLIRQSWNYGFITWVILKYN